ncbi:transglycosylase domain-containing protein [Pontibacter mangrovi]|uniref:Glycosyl transferase family 51 n=1 Tax=Pontibacter mangrovi TaxID=2589816 RepID=A0A501WG36_9BACT|nr:transglycosylase domain-containing protein [Pontibacter mangrovi]TPE44506.1 glycosyl transferase family 51 [Pontibacter mangrovi]
MIKKLFVFFGLVILAVFLYYFSVILIARANTKEIVNEALASDKMKLELNDLTAEQLDALLKIQDPNFYNHKGVDFATPGTGVTTISQGLVKMYYFENFKPGPQKVKQTLIARFAFDPLTPKDTILKLFVNEAYLGQENGKPVKGFEDASQYYFHKEFKQLNWDEYLSLLSMIRAPFKFHYFNEREKNLERVGRIKKVLAGDYTPVDNSDLFYDRR